MTHIGALTKRTFVAVGMLWAIVCTMMAGPIDARGEDSIDMLDGDCAHSKDDCLSASGPGGGFTMGAPSGNEQHHVTIGPSGPSQVITPGRDASVREYSTSNPSGSTEYMHHFEFHEGEPNSSDDETITILSEDEQPESTD